MKQKYLWFTDMHLDKITPWTLTSFIRHLQKEKPKAIFITGDISNGALTPAHLRLLAASLDCIIYFVLGNHDYHLSSIEKTHNKIKELCAKYPNLVWVTDNGVIELNEEACLIGHEGWYDAENGKPQYLQLTFDWFMVRDFRKLPNMDARIKMWRDMSAKSAYDIADKLEKAVEQDYKTIYVMTHFPPWKEATRDLGTFLEKFWLPYNTNLQMGRAIEDVMKDYKKRRAIVLAGHTHSDCWIHVSRNIECKVGRAKYYGYLRNEEHIYI